MSEETKLSTMLRVQVIDIYSQMVTEGLLLSKEYVGTRGESVHI
jgi:hypothetical protein